MADATSYAEAETGGFVISVTNAIALKIAGAILPIDDIKWHDAKLGISGSLAGGGTIEQEGAIGGIMDGARFTNFDGVDDVVDMGQSYTQTAVSPPTPNWALEGGPAAAIAIVDHDLNTGTLISERGGTNTPLQIFSNGTNGEDLAMGRIAGNAANNIAGGLNVIGVSLVDVNTLIGYIDGVAENTQNPSAPDVGIRNLSIGARWEGYPNPAFLYSGKIYMALMFNIDLSAAEHLSINNNPWQIFEAAVVGPTPPVNDTPMPNQECTVGVAFGPLDISGFWSGDPAPTFTMKGQPTGLSIDSAGVISGTPTGGFDPS